MKKTGDTNYTTAERVLAISILHQLTQGEWPVLRKNLRKTQKLMFEIIGRRPTLSSIRKWDRKINYYF